MPNVAVIVVAAGSGSRFGGNESKVFALLDGQPLVIRALQLFVNREDVCQTVLAIAPGDISQVKSKFGPNLGFMGVRLVEGGAERVDSVEKALGAIGDDADLVAVHDAARPCVIGEWIDMVIAEAGKSGAAILATPVTATLKRVSAAKVIDRTEPRGGLWLAQTPQVFRKDILKAAYAARARVPGPVTDDAQLVEALGHPVSVVEGDARNIKITTRGDMSLASAVLKTLPQPKPKAGPLGAFDEAKW